MKGLLRRSSAVFQWRLYREILAASERCPPSVHHETAYPLLSRHHVPQAFSFIPLSSSVAVYTKCASNGRPFQAWLYTKHTTQHKLLYEETLASSTLDVALTRDGQFVTINSNTRTDSEVHVMRTLDAQTGSCEPLLVRPREEGVEYYMEHGHNDIFYILTNAPSGCYYKVMIAASHQPSSWTHYYQPPQGTVLLDLELYSGGLLLYCLKEGAPIVAALYPEHKQILVGDQFTEVKGGGGHYNCSEWPVLFSSPTAPPTATHIAGPPPTGDKGTQTASVHMISPSNDRYCIERREAVSTDGTQVPLTLCYQRGALKGSNLNPVLVHVYGCYGECVPIGWQAEGLPLLERGWVMAYAHTRGGGERGRGWYHSGMAHNKHKTFQDLAACVASVQCDISQPRLTALVGESAGALPVGMFSNLWPHLLQAAILKVPLVNLCHALSDLSNYLACKDKLEFGGYPHGTRSEREHIASICPYSTLRPQDYPAVYVRASRNDEVIPFSGVVAYVRRLRECGANVVFKVDSVHGHHDNGDAKERATNAAKQIMFLYKALQLDIAE
ncbi:prolyl endopeptidase-like [Halichondria panicea]|uniref:prolyl endopeptidase-like n=1 Tax=Halichondria panicea TaxID=6063 RepID=UPI00312B8599